MLSNKILVGNHFNYEKIRNIIIQKKTENKYKCKSTFNILNRFLKDCKKKYKIKCKKITEDKARDAINETRPCIIRFVLNEEQKKIFNKFFKENPKGVLTKEIINVNKNNSGKLEGHAAVLTHIENGCLKILNSFGQKWGDKGYFRVKNGDVLNMEFCEIYYDFSDLNEKEKKEFNNFMNDVKDFINDIFFD